MIVSSFKACGISVASDGSEDSSILCFKQSGIAADTALCISQLTAEMLAACDNDDDDPFLSSDDDEDKLETNELIIEDTDWLHLDILAQALYCTLRNENMQFTCVGGAFQIALLNIIVLALV